MSESLPITTSLERLFSTLHPQLVGETAVFGFLSALESRLIAGAGGDESQLTLLSLSENDWSSLLTKWEEEFEPSDSVRRGVHQFVHSLSDDQTRSAITAYLLALTETDCSPATRRNYRSDISQFSQFVRSETLEGLLTKPKFADFLEYQRRKGLAEASVRRKQVSITGFANWLAELGWFEGEIVTDAGAGKLMDIKIKADAELAAERRLQAGEVILPVPPSEETDLSRKAKAAPEGKVAKEVKAVKTTTASSPIPKATSSADAKLTTSTSAPAQPPKHRFRSWPSNTLLMIFNFGLLIFFLLGLGWFGWQQLRLEAPGVAAYPNELVRPSRTLSFQGRLTNTAQTPISGNVDMRFRLYDNLTGPTLVWDSGNCTANADQDGIFTVGLGGGGTNCGPDTLSDVFSENPALYLEVEVATEVLSPRQPIRTVAYAINAETLQGFPPADPAVSSSVLVLDENGNLNIGSTSPTITSTSGTFTLTGEALRFETVNDGDISLSPDGLGGVIIENNAGASRALIIEAAASQTANLTEWVDNVGTPLAVVDAGGNIGIGTSAPAYALDVNRVDGGGISARFLGRVRGADAVNADEFATLGQLSSQLLPSGTSGQTLRHDGTGWVNNSLLFNDGTNVGIGTTTTSAKLSIGAAANAINIFSDGGKILWQGGSTTEISGGSNLTLSAFNGARQIRFNTAAGNIMTITQPGLVGIGTTAPSQKLDVVGNIQIDGNSAFMQDGQQAFKLALGTDTFYANTYAGVLAGSGAQRQSAFGYQAGQANTGLYQSAFGYLAGQANTGASQSAFGYSAGRLNTGLYQSAFGYVAGSANTGNYQSAFGFWAGRANTGASQSAFGYYAGRDNTGAHQSAFGYQAGQANTGDRQSAFGYAAGNQNTGDRQSAFGYAAGYLNEGHRVTGIGYEATRDNTGDDVVAIGYQAGLNNTLANQFIIQQANINATPLIQGNFQTGNLGIGTTAPSQRLDVAGAIRLGAAGANNVLNTTSTGVGNDPTGSLYWGNRELVDSSNIGNFGVASVTGTANQILAAPNSGNVVLSLPTNLIVPGSIDITTNLLMGGVETITSGRLLRLASGSAAAPAFSFTDNTNLGIFRAAADTLAFSTAGTERLRIGATGNIGVGTTTPASKFDINYLAGDTIGSIFRVANQGTTLFEITPSKITSALPHEFTSSGDVTMAYDLLFTNPSLSTIKSAANLNIEAGTPAGSSFLTLRSFNNGSIILNAGGSTSGGGSVLFEDSSVKSATNTTPIAFTLASTDINSFRTNFTNESVIGAINEAYVAATTGGGIWTLNNPNLYPADTAYNLAVGATDALGNKLRVVGNTALEGNATISGNVGIGTTAPGAKLHVLSSDGFSYTTSTGGTLDVGYNTSSRVALTQNIVGWGATLGASGAGGIRINGGSGTYSYISGNGTSLILNGGGGNVGIGTTAPAQRLHVAGGRSRFDNDLTTGSYFQMQGVHADGRQELIHYSDSGSSRIFAARGGYSGSVVLGPAISGGIATPSGLAGPIAFGNNTMSLSAFAVGGIVNSGTHQSLAIGTPNSSWQTGFGGSTFVDIATFSTSSNTWGGTRPAIRLTGNDLIFRTDASTGSGNPGAEVMRITGNNVGIGSTAPSERLDVAGAIRLGTAGANNVLNTSAAAGAATGPLYWGNEQLITDGTIGSFGVSSITGTVNQIDASASTGAVTLSLPSDLRAPGTFNAVTSIATGAGAGTVRIDASGNLTNIGTISASGNITSSGGVLSMGGVGNNYFAGNVGIGTTNPTANVHIYQNAPTANQVLFRLGTSDDATRFSVDEDGDVYLRGDLQAGSSSSSIGSLTNRFDLLAGKYLDLERSTSSAPIIKANQTGTADILALYDDSNLAFQVQDGGNTIVRIGNLGIGTTAPSQKLDVNGAIRLGAAGANNVLNTTAAGAAPTGSLFWGNRELIDSSNIGTFGVSSVTNSDGTLSISPTTGSVVASLNLANANTWTGAQTFSANTNFPGGVWNTSGNVGIGTTAPSHKLDVAGAIRAETLLSSAGGMQKYINPFEPLVNGGSHAGNQGNFYTVTENVHFGSAQVYSYSDGNIIFVLRKGHNLTGEIVDQKEFSVTTGWNTLTFDWVLTSSVGDWTITKPGGGSPLLFRNNSGTSYPQEFGSFSIVGTGGGDDFYYYLYHMLVSGTRVSGNVGIGTTTPAYKLDVAGDINFTGALRAGGLSGNAGEVLLSQGTGTPVWSDISGAIGNTAWLQGGNSFGALGVLGTNDNYGLQFKTNNAARMTITDAGNVGIGTTTPSYKIDVFGDATTDAVSSRVGFNIDTVDAPPSTFTATAVAGSGLEIGNYYYRITYYTAIGETNASSFVSVTTTPGNQQINLTNLPTSTDPTVIGRKIYRGKVGESSSYGALVGTIANNVDTTFLDSYPDSNIIGSTLTRSIHSKPNTTSNFISVNNTRALILDPSLTSVGFGAGANVENAAASTFFGYLAGGNVTSGGGNTLIGNVAGRQLTTGSNNVALGNGALQSASTGSYNIAIGWGTLDAHTSASHNISLGYNSGGGLTGGVYNVAIGNYTNQSVGSRNNNTMFGSYAGSNLTSGSSNLLLGYGSGDNLTTGSNNIILGSFDAPSATGSNQLNIGNALFGNLSAGDIGIGTTSPSQRLDVNGAIRLGAAGANNVLNTTAAGAAPTGSLFWGNRELIDSSNIGTFGVSSVTNSDGTLTISPTTGNVIASLNLGNANSWTGAQTFTANTNFPGGVWNTSGNVGIGTTAPSAALHLFRSSGSTYLQIDNTNTTGASNLQFRNDLNNYLDVASWGSSNAGTVFGQSVADKIGIRGTSAILFGTTSNDDIYIGTNGITRVTVKNDGLLGIGTTTPETRFVVNHGGAVPALTGGPTSTNTSAIFSRATALNNINRVLILAGTTGSTGSSILGFGDADDSEIGSIAYDHNLDSLNFSSNNATRMTIDSAGLVGIGSTAPSQLLDVAGAIRLGAAGANNVLNTTAAGGAATGSLYWGDAELVDSSNIGSFGVSSVTGTANQITAAPTSGAVVLSLPSDLRAPGTFNAVTSIATGAGAGTVRIDASGNLTNIGNITASGNITTSGGTLTVSGTGDSSFAGNVGIGTTAPSEKLHVSAGNVRIDNMTTAGFVKNSATGVLSGGHTIGAADMDTGNLVNGTGIAMTGTLTDRLVGTGNVTVGVGTTVPTSVTNDTNVTGSIANNVLTLGWTGTLATGRGGTGLNTYATGDLLYASAANTLSRRAAGNAGQVLTMVSGVPTWADAGAAGSASLSSLTAATTANTINNGDHAQVWNWALTTAGKSGLTLGENTASTATGTSSILSVSTLASSTATPLHVKNLGNGYSLRVDDEATDTTPFIIDNAGNVGIGTTTANQKLHVVGGGYISTGLSVGHATVTTGVVNAGTGFRVNNAATAGNYLRGNGTNFVASTIQAADLPGTFSGFANPSATIGLTAINGTATTAMRSDAAPALSQAIVPTWTGAHTFSANTNFPGGVWNTSGDVGIGSTTPGAKLDVNGTLRANNTVTLTGLSAGTETNSLMINGSGVVSTRTLGSLAFDSSLAFTDLTDTPANYTGSANYLVKVNAATNGLEFVDASTVGGVSSVTGTANQITASPTSGAVVLSLPSDLRAPGTFNAVTSIATGAGAGTVRLDASGNLTNIGTIASTYLTTSTNVVNLAGASTALQMNGVETITSGRLARLATGTAAAPAYSFTDNNNMGMFRAAANILAFSTAGTERLRIGATGNVGIGTTTTNSKLSVVGTNSGNPLIYFNETGAEDLILMQVGGNDRFKVDNSGYTHSQRFVDLANSNYYLDPAATGTSLTVAGSVGIGTTNPGYKLHLTGGNALFNNGTDVKIYLNDTHNYIGTTQFNPTVVQGYNGVRINRFGGNEVARFGISDTSNDSYFTGNLGIGTTAPAARLDIAGASSTITNTSGDITIDSASDVISFAGDQIGNFSRARGGTGTAALPTYSFSSSISSGLYSPTTDTLGFSTDGAERLRISNTGNVGIGTTNPAHRLDVVRTSAPGSGANFAIRGLYEYGTATTNAMTGFAGNVRTTHASGTTTNAIALTGTGEHAGAGIVTNLRGAQFSAWNSGSGTVTEGVGFFANVINTGAGSIGTAIGFKIPDITSGTDNFSIHTGTAKSYFGGNVGIGTTNPGSALQVGNGTGSQIIRVFGADTGQSGINIGASQTNRWIMFQDTAANNRRWALYEDHTGVSGSTGYRMVAEPGGNIGIGTTSAGARLEVRGSGTILRASDSNDTRLSVLTNYTQINHDGHTVNSNNWTLELRSPNISNREVSARFHISSQGWGQIRFRPNQFHFTIGDSGTYIPVNASAFTVGSDIRLKENVNDYSSALDLISNLRPVEYNLKDTGEFQIGFIAQEVQQFLPSVVNYDPSTTLLSLDYAKFTPIAIKGIQEQQGQIANLNNTQNSLISQLNNAQTTLNSHSAKLQQIEGMESLTISDAGSLTITKNATTGQYQVVTPQTNLITTAIGAGEAVIGQLRAGLIQTQELIANLNIQTPELRTDLIRPLGGSDVTIQLGERLEVNQPSALRLENAAGQEVARIDDQGNTSLLGSLLVADELEVEGDVRAGRDLEVGSQLRTADLQVGRDATIAGALRAQSARISQLESNLAEFAEVRAQTASFVDASVSGTLYSATIDGFQDRVASAMEEPTLLQKLFPESTAWSHERLLQIGDATVSAQLADLELDASTRADSIRRTFEDLNLASTDLALTAEAAYITQYFQVNGAAFVAQNLGLGGSLIADGELVLGGSALIRGGATIANSLAVGESIFASGSITAGGTTVVGDGYIAYLPAVTAALDPEADPFNKPRFEIQPSGKGMLSLMAGILAIDESGQVMIRGNLNIAGNLTVEDTLLTDMLSPTDFTNPLQIKLASRSGELADATESGQVAGATTDPEVLKSRFEIVDENGVPVATISADGRAAFTSGLEIGAEYEATVAGQPIITNRTTGVATVKQGELGITIYSEKITEDSLIYVTPLGPVDNQVLFVKDKVANNPETEQIEGRVVVGFQNPTTRDVRFNWWIVN